MVFQYDKTKLENLSIDKFFNACQVEGLLELDMPGSTSPLNLLPLFQNPTELFPIYKKNPFKYKPGDFPKAEKFYKNALKLPVWSDEKDENYVKLYSEGLKKVLAHYKEIK